MQISYSLNYHIFPIKEYYIASLEMFMICCWQLNSTSTLEFILYIYIEILCEWKSQIYISPIFNSIANIENHIERKSVQMDSQGSSRRSSACSVPDVDTCGLEEEQVWGLGTSNCLCAFSLIKLKVNFISQQYGICYKL